MAVPVLQVTFSVVIALFLLQLLRRLTANSQNGIAKGLKTDFTRMFQAAAPPAPARSPAASFASTSFRRWSW